MSEPLPQSPHEILLIKPRLFSFNLQTARTNFFQHTAQDENSLSVHDHAMQEFEALRETYIRAGIKVHVLENGDRRTPDAIFPNSIITFPAGYLDKSRSYTLHPMLERNRRAEKTPEFLDFLNHELAYERVKDFSAYEAQRRALEGTGSLVLDRCNKIAYCALSARSDPDIAQEFCDFAGFELVAFSTDDGSGREVYHTDVIMHIGTGVAGICLEAVVPRDRRRIEKKLGDRREVVSLSLSQMNDFCGNALEVSNSAGERFLSLSGRAYGALTPSQKDQYLKHMDDILHTAIPTIEYVGGGSVRCMTQELF